MPSNFRNVLGATVGDDRYQRLTDYSKARTTLQINS